MTEPGQDRSSQIGPDGGLNLRLWGVVFALACLAYANTLANRFVFDDIPIILQNPHLKGWSGLGPLLVSNYWAGLGESIAASDRLWRPLTLFAFFLNARLTGLTPWGYHLVNVLLHAGVSVLVMGVGRRVGLGVAGSLVAGVAFALHPIHTEAVANVVGRAELLAALFFLGATGLWVRGWVAGKAGALVAAAGLVFFGLAAKENVATFPLVAALAVWVIPVANRSARSDESNRSDQSYRSDRSDQSDQSDRLDHPLAGGSSGLRPRIQLLALGGGALVFTIGLYILLRVAALGQLRFESPLFIPGLLYEVSLAQRWLTAAEVAARYAWLMVWPMNLSADYSYNAIPLVKTFAHLPSLAGFGVIAGLASGAWMLRRRCPAAAIGFGFALATFALTANLLFPIKTLMAERLAYLPSAGLAWAAGAGAEALWNRTRQARGFRGLLVAAGLVLAVVWFARTVVRNIDWSTHERLFLSITQAQPHSSRGHFNLAETLRLEAGDCEGAIEQYRRSLAILPNDPEAWRAMADCHLRLSRPHDALHALERTLALNPGNREVRGLIDRIRQRLGATAAPGASPKPDP